MIGLDIRLSLPHWMAEFAGIDGIYPTDTDKMGLAIELSQRNVVGDQGGPFGAALFDDEGRLVGLGVNQVVPQNCSAAHAEMMAYMSAQQALGRFRLDEDGGRYTLATSSQPCCQCYGATFWSGISELLIGARGEDVESLTEFDEGPLPEDWVGELERRGIAVRRDILREDACAVLRMYTERGGRMY
jgi:tRNA(Arg) A34 adenosine deaminase TadA